MVNFSRALGLVAPIVALLVGFMLGRSGTDARPEDAPGAAQSLQARILQLDEALKKATGELEMVRTRNEVNRQALEILRLEMASGKEHTAELEAGLRFYRSLMTPGEADQGVTVREPELVATERPRRYAFRLIVQQEATKHELVRGRLGVSLAGLLDGEEVSYELSQLADALPEDALELQFRYFQSIQGELTLPEGFQPESFALVTTVSKPRAQEYRHQHDWRVQERFTHVGK
jgi:hypothetical protein